MTRKDFETIAAAIYAVRDFAGHAETVTGAAAHAALDRAAENLAVRLAATNPRFQTRLFLAACGVTS
jgi:hypothetical protein